MWCQDNWARPRTHHHSHRVDLLQIALCLSLRFSLLSLYFKRVGSPHGSPTSQNRTSVPATLFPDKTLDSAKPWITFNESVFFTIQCQHPGQSKHCCCKEMLIKRFNIVSTTNKIAFIPIILNPWKRSQETDISNPEPIKPKSAWLDTLTNKRENTSLSFLSELTL